MLNSKGEKVCPLCNLEKLQYNDVACFECARKSDGIIGLIEELDKQIKVIDNMAFFLYNKGMNSLELCNSSLNLIKLRDKLKGSKEFKIEMMTKYAVHYDL